MKLIYMTDFILEQSKIATSMESFTEKVIVYAEFLKKPLLLGFFIPCDLNNNVLDPFLDIDEFKEANERVLFDGFRIENNVITNDQIGISECLSLYSDIESLIIDLPCVIELTDYAKNQLGI